MTYGVQTYEFTAFTEADLLQGVNGKSIGCGDVFTMPASATTCFSVKDNDTTMSGDACNNEKGDDSSYQTADIEVDGVQVFDNMKIYAESYHVLEGSDGKTYYMIEIETREGGAPGKGDDFFTFYGDVPADGVELTVVNTCNVTSNWVDYKCLSAGSKEWELEDDCRYTLEAEDMNLYGYKTEHNDAASGDELIKLKNDVGYAKADFGGESGQYDIKICYVDENDGEGFIDIFVNGVFVGCIDLSENDNGNGVSNTTFSEFVIEGVQINEGDQIKLKGRQDGCEFARIDKIVFEQCDEPDFRECDDPNAVKLDFEGFAAGTVFDDEYSAFGVTISAQREGDDPNSENDAMIFDSANPTGGDTDLATADQGNVLIVSEDNDSSDPDDNIGGTIVFDFANPSFVFDIKVIDTEEGGTIELFDADGASLGTFAIPQIGDGDIDQVLIDVDGVSRMEVTLNGSGAIDDICIVPGQEQPGSLSGTYFCDDDRDGVDDGNANGDLDVAGKLVTLLLADGVTPATDFDGNPVGSILTDAEGNYRFDNLAAGDYVVMFENSAAEGKEFIAQDVGNDDAIDSDANPDDGKTAPVTVEAGKETKDVDVGVQKLLGSLAGRYFCDTNDDDLDDNNGDEPGINGQLVTLVNVGTGDIQTTLTQTIDGVDGSYFFGDLEAGDYRVIFEADQTGKVFVAQTLGDNDSIGGSDANPADGETDVFVLAPGENKKDVDVGVVEPNQDPEPLADELAVCSDVMTTVDVLANDSDPDGDTPVITAIAVDAGLDGVFGTADDVTVAVTDGGPAVTLASGAEVSLLGGELKYDLTGADDFDLLEIGQEAADQFAYVVEDGNGGSGSAVVDVTVCGALNTLDSIQRSFLDVNDDPILASYNVEFVGGGVFPVTVKSDDERLAGPTGEKVYSDDVAYCIDRDGGLPFGNDVPSEVYVADVGNTALFDALAGEANVANLQANLDAINWILNQDFQNQDSGLLDDGDPNTPGSAGENYDFFEVQDAIWILSDGAGVLQPGTPEAENAQEIADAALAFGEGFEAGEGDLVGVVFVPTEANLQTYLVGVPFDDLAEDCICA